MQHKLSEVVFASIKYKWLVLDRHGEKYEKTMEEHSRFYSLYQLVYGTVAANDDIGSTAGADARRTAERTDNDNTSGTFIMGDGRHCKI